MAFKATARTGQTDTHAQTGRQTRPNASPTAFESVVIDMLLCLLFVLTSAAFTVTTRFSMHCIVLYDTFVLVGY